MAGSAPTRVASVPGTTVSGRSVSNVTGFRAKVQYQSGGTNKFQEVLIKDLSFRIGDTKFTLSALGKAEIKNVVTDPSSGQTYLDQAYAKRSS